MIEVMAVS